ncbi:YcaO-like family protein [Streptomyces sedi]|uniref:YcaO domain-containing protein n=1 Tax=Streptomyces sedi TaxID=555059 RepID=A0A5C4VDX7_9ACTN|nr:YcaO-like family protein [Streptomyces sedi]TNM33626.1 hypothetical protein FH715_04585 [Streptomyces sedi]
MPADAGPAAGPPDAADAGLDTVPDAAGPDTGPDLDAVVSPRTGIVTHVMPFVSELLPRAMVTRLALTARPELLPGVAADFSVMGFGVGTSAAEARVGAVGETLERYGSLVGGALVPVERGSYRDLGADAVPGDAFALPSRATPSSCVPWDETAPRGWVEGHDLTRDRRVWVPAQLALPCYRARFDGEDLSPWTTTGLAAHTDPEAAVLAGLREVEERDAFTIRHLNRWTPPEIPLFGVADDVDALLASLPRWLDLEVRAWDLTLDLGQPVVLAGVLPNHPDLPPFCFGASCRGDYPSALRKAVLEAFQIVAVMARRGFPATATAEPLEELADPEDHIRMTCQPGYRDSLRWLLHERVPWRPPGGRAPARETTLAEAVEAVARRGMRVISVDLTPPDLRELGWHVVKTLVPGSQPLSFGRLQCLGGERLYRLPVELGHRREPARESELNPAPHPFA